MSIPESLRDQVMAQLPTTDTLGTEMQAEQVIQELLPLIEENALTAVIASQNREGFLLFIRGELVSAQCGNKDAVSALELLYTLPAFAFSAYQLPYEHARAMLALTHGIPRSVVPQNWKDLHLSLYQEVFTGCSLQETGKTTRVCLWVDGDALHPLQETDGATYQVLEVPHPLPPNIMMAYRTYHQQKRNAEIHSLWFKLEIILREFVGRGAPAALQHLKNLHRNEMPEELRQSLRQWIQDTLDEDALAMFDA